ncbi:MarR family winged helix-turn-helix transcriptional regulator [Kribbella jiaozuonensis]|uniref:MarR family transcriptional regulator n=1 Tax=Kribbella jiaozuonensis TaxID=2575441 RepID=A0A4V5UVF6_9ACTN|nr:MarR family transcriptional regulator [Kribbella jiaozuonensis]TKK72863.1 MarR family transcriptional regulator [Kribbella jiaozuonensis]TKK74093.1 MarR family transcriptional regulator [Kribbella jiaozuonensis]
MVTTTARDSDLASALVQTMHRLQDLHAETSRPLGLTPQQAHLLCVLITGPLGMTELSRILSIERSSLTSMVDRLERRDLVARVANPADRRACRIELTPAGKDLAHQCHDAVVDRIATLTGDLPAATRTTLTTALKSILTQ